MAEADSKYIDVNTGLPRVANNEALYKKLLAKFAASVDIDNFNSSIAQSDFLKAGEIVHAAKGVAGNLALAAFFEHSVILMDQLRGGGTPVPADVEKFKQLYNETIRAIDSYLA